MPFLRSPLRLFALFVLFQAIAPNRLCALELGVNLDDQGAFVNIVNHTARYSNATGYDAYGWPTSDFQLVLLDGRPATEWNGTIDDPEQHRISYSGIYLSQFTGQATVQASGTDVTIGNVRYDTITNVTSFDLVIGGAGQPNHGLVFLQFTNTKRLPLEATGTGITNLIVNRPGYPRGAAQTFTDAFIKLCQAAEFAAYRFYNVQNIWNGEPTFPTATTWSQRKTPRDAAQVSMAGTNGKRDGWCWEYIVELATILRKDIWICMHMSCDSAYVTSLAEMLKNELDPSINIYVESSNEVWSPTQATHGPYNAAQAQARGISFDENHAHRTVELSRWFGEVFGPSSINQRVRVIMAGQHAYHGRSDNHLNYIQRTFGAPNQFVYATSTALYFGSTMASSSNEVTINTGMIEDISVQITDPQSATYRNNHLAKAASWGLVGGATSYEGGPHLPAGGGLSNLAVQIRSHRTREMGDVIRYNYLEGWRALGGGLAMYFTLASAYNRYGCWGLTDDYTEPDRNYKMQAMRDIIATTSSVVANEKSVTLIVSIDAATHSLRARRSDGMQIAVLNVYDITGAVVDPSSSLLPGVYAVEADGVRTVIAVY